MPLGIYYLLFTIKYLSDESVECFKALIVATGVDYFETLNPVSSLNSVQILISVVVNSGWLLHQLDIKNAFLIWQSY